jgi:hypothetical protein
MSFLDRVNVGTAKLAGLSEDLGMSPGQFNLISTGFFITYVCESSAGRHQIGEDIRSIGLVLTGVGQYSKSPRTSYSKNSGE